MNKFIAIQNLSAVFAGKATIPTITLWNRLEGRPRTHDFQRALRAEVHDALWMLTKQWQMGEFQGDDAGSPVIAKVHIETTELTNTRRLTIHLRRSTMTFRSKPKSSSGQSRSTSAGRTWPSTSASPWDGAG